MEMSHRVSLPRVSKRILVWLAWALWAVFMVLAVGLVLFGFLNGSSESWGQVFASLAIATFPTVGALVAARRPMNPMGWLILAIALSFVSSSFAYQYALHALITAPGALPAGLAMAWLSAWAGLPGSVLLLTFFFLLFPTGHLPSPRWRALAWLAGAVLVLSVLGKAFAPGSVFIANSPIRNPLGIESAGPFLIGLNGIFQITGIPIGVLCGASTILRFRRARGEERQQLKWFAYAILMIVLFFAVNLAPRLNPAWKPRLPESVLDVIFGLVISLPALAIGIAILKYRLYDIDVVIRRTVTYGLLTALLLVVYFGGVVLFQQVFVALTGQRQDLAIILSTLAIAALSIPLRNRIQSIIDRRFYRRKYDAAQVLESFAHTARDEVDPQQLTSKLLDAVEETMQPEKMGLWISADVQRQVRQGGMR